MRWQISLAVALAGTLTLSAATAADPAGFKTLEIGDAAPDFKLPASMARIIRSPTLPRPKLLAILFTCNHCPTAQAYEDRILQLHADYKDRASRSSPSRPTTRWPCGWTSWATPTSAIRWRR